jgi:hypothetical protein
MIRDVALITVALAGVLGLAAPRPVVAASPRFLTLPFASTVGMHVQRGWWALGHTLLHHAVDYVHGTPDEPSTWESFGVLAAAPGVACGQVAGRRGCVDVPGERSTNRVLIRHDVEGGTFYTLYEDLASIAPGIPLGSVHRTALVERGEWIGAAGADHDLIHLHFEMLDAAMKPIDPYDIRGSSRQYPDPSGGNETRSGPSSFWLTDPPAPPSSLEPAPRATSSGAEAAPPVPSVTSSPPESTGPAVVGPNHPGQAPVGLVAAVTAVAALIGLAVPFGLGRTARLRVGRGRGEPTSMR